jgi:DNA-binding response OmpR family regulator
MEPTRILVVDDERNIRTSVRNCLEAEGYIVREAQDGREALAAVVEWSPDLVLLDLAMPVLDGMATLKELRDRLGHDMPRVVIATAHGSVKAAIEAMRLGADDFVEKPLLPDELRQSVAGVLKNLPSRDPDLAGGYDGVLNHVREAIRDGNLGAAESLLMMAGTISEDDPSFMNLAGLVHEGRGRIESARRFYERALAVDPGFAPASENLLRCSS